MALHIRLGFSARSAQRWIQALARWYKNRSMRGPFSKVSPACRKRRLIGAVCRNHRNVSPVSALERARERTLQNVYGVGSPTLGPTTSSFRLHIYVPSHV